jgi:hypothetical protein
MFDDYRQVYGKRIKTANGRGNCVPCLGGKQTKKKLGKGGQPKMMEVLVLIHLDY